jgi:hypothetical protein
MSCVAPSHPTHPCLAIHEGKRVRFGLTRDEVLLVGLHERSHQQRREEHERQHRTGGGVKKSTPSESAEAPSATHHIHRLSTVLFLKGRGADTQDEV